MAGGTNQDGEDKRVEVTSDAALDATIAAVFAEVERDAKIDAEVNAELRTLEARELLRHVIGESCIRSQLITDADLQKLVETVESNPLALKLAGSYINQNPMSVKQYSTKYAECKLRVGQVLAKEVSPVEVAFEITRFTLTNTHPIAAGAPQYLSLLAPDPHIIPNELLGDLFSEEDVKILAGYALLEKRESGVLVDMELQKAVREGVAWKIALAMGTTAFVITLLSFIEASKLPALVLLPHLKCFHEQLKTIRYNESNPKEYRMFLKKYANCMKEAGDVSQPGIRRELAGIYKERGANFFGKREYKKALEQYQKVVRYCPEDKAAHLNQAMCLCRLNRYEEALQAADQALQLDSTYDKAAYYKALALTELQRYSEAQALVGEPHSAENQQSWSKLQHKLQQGLAERNTGATVGVEVAAAAPAPALVAVVYQPGQSTAASASAASVELNN